MAGQVGFEIGEETRLAVSKPATYLVLRANPLTSSSSSVAYLYQNGAIIYLDGSGPGDTNILRAQKSKLLNSLTKKIAALSKNIARRDVPST